MKKYSKRLFGFTLLELLIVIAIIGILTSISFVALNGARKQGRDGRRKSDLETIRSALELFKADCNLYPSSLPVGQLQGTAALGCSPANTNVYYQRKPTDPTTSLSYIYNRTSTTTYTLWTSLEDPGTAPAYCTSPPSCGSATCNFCVVNP